MAAPACRVICWGTSSGRSCTITCQPPAGVAAGGGDVAAEADQHAGAEALVHQPRAPVGGDGLRGRAEVELGAGRHLQPATRRGSSARHPAGRRTTTRERAPVASYLAGCRGRSRARPAPSRGWGRPRRRSRGPPSRAAATSSASSGLSSAAPSSSCTQRHQLAVRTEPAAGLLDPRPAPRRRGRSPPRSAAASVTTRRHAVLQSSQSRAVRQSRTAREACELEPVPGAERGVLCEEVLEAAGAADRRAASWAAARGGRGGRRSRRAADDAAGGGQRGRDGAARRASCATRPERLGAVADESRGPASVVHGRLLVVSLVLRCWGSGAAGRGPGRTRRRRVRPAGRQRGRVAGSAGCWLC